MSQFFQGVTAGSLPPSVPTSFVTDNGTSIPALNIENVVGGTSTANNSNGIATKANPNGSKNLEIDLTNRAVGSVTTTDASLVTLLNFPLGAVASMYAIQVRISGYIPASNTGGAYFVEVGARTNGVAGFVVGNQSTNIFEDPAIVPALVTIGPSGNNILITVNGIAATTIHWFALLEYIQTS